MNSFADGLAGPRHRHSVELVPDWWGFGLEIGGWIRGTSETRPMVCQHVSPSHAVIHDTTYDDEVSLEGGRMQHRRAVS